ncbi:MAG: hypothetical protein IKS16_04355 [Lachnospiraceae bacterium]|nr:hypothetical protein [Lachnospiraceae bacterium]
MGQGDQELQKNKKPVEIKVTRDAEDVVKGPNVAFMIDRPSELNEISAYDVKKAMNNRLVTREAKRRVEEGGFGADIDYYAELAEKPLHEFIDQAEKNWVSGEMEKLQRQAEERKAREEQERKERQAREEEERKEREAREEQARKDREAREEKNRTERKERERLFIEENLHMTERRLEVHLPAKTALALKYESKFSSSISDKKRKEKQKNKKSRLYQKIQNENLLKAEIAKEQNAVYERAAELITKDDDISAEDFNDMAQFMMRKDKYQNQPIVELMLGGRNAEGKRCVDEYHARLALTRMADQLIGMDVSGLKLDTDHDIAANAYQLEGLANRLAAFSRLSAKYNYMETLDDGRRQALYIKLEALRSVAAYYTMRKSIITDPMYRDHYDHELSMDVTKTSKGADHATAEAQRALAEKLVKSYILGRNMMRINGVPVKTINKKMPELRFKNAAAAEFYNNAKSELDEYTNAQNVRHIVRDGYTVTDQKAADKLAELREEPAMRAEAEVGLDQAIETEEQAERHQNKMAEVENRFADDVLKTLLTSDELIPLKGTREMGAVRNSIQALQAMLSNQMPTVKMNDDGEVDAKAEAEARKEIDGTCIAVVMLYKRMSDSIDGIVKKYGKAYSDMAAMLKELSEQSKKEAESFREKTLEYRALLTSDAALRSEPRTWMDAVKYNRGVFYDLDNDETLKVKTDGAGASRVYRIVKKVPVTKDNPKGEEVVYFRKKDSVPPADDNQLNEAVISRFEVGEKTAASLKYAFRLFMSDRRAWAKQKMPERFKIYKKNQAKPAEIAGDFIRIVNRTFNKDIDISEEDMETAGQIILEWNDDCSKRVMANTMKISARIRHGRPLSDRNVVTSRLATLLGIQSMVCDSRTATIRMGGKVIEGNLMEDTGGEETGKKKRAYTQNAISQLFMVNTFDFICGQTDRHFANFHAKVKGGDYDDIRCLDNDMAFGDLKSTNIGNRSYNRIMPVTEMSLMGLPVSFVNRMMAIDRPYLDQALGDILDKGELDALEDRLNYVKMRIVDMANERQDTKWDDKTKKLSYKGYMADDAYRQLWCVEGLYQEAAETKDGEMGWISKFMTDNVDVTPIREMMNNRKQAMTAQQKKGKKK